MDRRFSQHTWKHLWQSTGRCRTHRVFNWSIVGLIDSKKAGAGGRHSREVAFALTTLLSQVRFLAFPKCFRCCQGFLTTMLLRTEDSSSIIMLIKGWGVAASRCWRIMREWEYSNSSFLYRQFPNWLIGFQEPDRMTVRNWTSWLSVASSSQRDWILQFSECTFGFIQRYCLNR